MGNPPKIGKNILRIRNAQNLTLNVLSERSGVSKAMLSQIETDKVNPTVATVWKIAGGLSVELNDLLGQGIEHKRQFIINPNNSLTSSKMETIENGVKIKVLSPLAMVEDLEMYYITMSPESSLPSNAHYDGTQEFLTILKGQVEVKAGENDALLKKGDFLIYHADIEHIIINSSNHEAVIHMVVRYHKK